MGPSRVGSAAWGVVTTRLFSSYNRHHAHILSRSYTTADKRISEVSHSLGKEPMEANWEGTRKFKVEDSDIGNIGPKVLSPHPEMFDITQSLPVVNKIHKELNNNGSMVIWGAPSTGKTEQVALACENYHLFDLRNEFISESGVTYENYQSLKAEEKEWLKENYHNILNDLVDSEEEVILLDEFDLTSGSSLSTDERETAFIIAQLAQDLKANGKKVILVLHEASLADENLMNHLNSMGLINGNEGIVQTGYIPQEAEEKILDFLEIDEKDQQRIMNYAKGLPVVYLPFFKGKYENDADTLLKLASEKIRNNLHIMERIQPPEFYKLLIDIANSESINMKDPLIVKYHDKLVQLGFVKEENNEFNMVPIMRDAILHNENMKQVKEFQVEGKPKTPSKSVSDALEHVKKNGGGVFLPGLSEYGAVIPNCPTKIKHQWRLQRTKIANIVKSEELPQASDVVISASFNNTAGDVTTLLSNAKELEKPFLNIINTVCKESGTKSYMGEKNKHLLKTQESLQKKVDKHSQIKGVNPNFVVGKINDSMRGTIICSSPEQMAEALRILRNTAESQGYTIAVDDKFKEEYSSGYVGVHASVVLQGVNGENKPFTVIAELQFHLQEVHDGTILSPKECAHSLYKFSGDNKNIEFTRALEGASMALFGGALANVKLPEPVSFYI